MGYIMTHTIYSNCDIRGGRNITFGEGCVVQRDVWIDCLPNAKVVIGDGANIGRRCVIGCGKSVTIGKKVLLGPNVYINDMDHEYENPDKPIMDQGITNPKPISIGDDSWCGINSVILASVGKHCVIGANSVVTKEIPDYSVAVGQPARIVKHYDFKKKEWVTS